MKKLSLIMWSLVLALLVATPVNASDSIGIAFEGDSKKFVVFEGNSTNSAFEDMMPGEERTQTIVIKNDDYQSMKFYVKADQTQLLETNDSSQRIVYDIEFKNDQEVFYSGRVGAKETSAKENLKENYLLKTLEKGESTSIEMKIKIDGTSMDNTYQGNIGNLGLVFNVEVDTGNPVIEVIKKVPVINQIKGVDTGDMTNLTYIGIAFGASLIAIVMILVTKGKRDEENE